MRLIDADELCDDVDNYEFTEHSDYSNVRDMIDYAPTIDAELVKHGRWIFADDGYCRCSECNQKAPSIEDEVTMTDHCPNCGAKMDGGADDDET